MYNQIHSYYYSRELLASYFLLLRKKPYVQHLTHHLVTLRYTYINVYKSRHKYFMSSAWLAVYIQCTHSY